MEEMLDCPYLGRRIEEGLCYDIQMISSGMILPCALPEMTVDKKRAECVCASCQHRMRGQKE